MALAISSTALSSLPSREIHQKVFHERTATCLPRRTLTNATKGVPSVCDPLHPDNPLWFPSSSPSEGLDGIPFQISISYRLVSHQIQCGCDGRDHKANLFRYFISESLDAKVYIWSIPDRQVVDWTDLHEMVIATCYTPDGQLGPRVP